MARGPAKFRLRKRFSHALWIGALVYRAICLQGAAPGPPTGIPAVKISFRQVFFPTRSGAKEALRKTSASPDSISAFSLGGPPDISSFYNARSADEIAGIFGKKFADSLFQLKPGGWRGPIKSDYGWHVVWIE